MGRKPIIAVAYRSLLGEPAPDDCTMFDFGGTQVGVTDDIAAAARGLRSNLARGARNAPIAKMHLQRSWRPARALSRREAPGQVSELMPRARAGSQVV